MANQHTTGRWYIVLDRRDICLKLIMDYICFNSAALMLIYAHVAILIQKWQENSTIYWTVVLQEMLNGFASG